MSKKNIVRIAIVVGVVLLVAGKLTKSGSYGTFAKILTIALGFAILLAGLYLIYTGL